MSVNASEPVIRVRDVHKSFGTLEVLKGVSFDVDAGEVLAILGRSGSGKSTMLRCINRLEKINSGEIYVAGHAVHDPKLDERAMHLEVGIVFQSYNLFPHLTVEQNICLAPVVAKRMPRNEAREIANEVLRRVGLTEKAGAYPEQLSGGQQQRAAIARSLAMQPKVMLFDEVTSALDPELTGEVLRVIEDLADSGMTMLMVTHELGFARKVANSVVFFHQGQVRESGSPKIIDQPETPEFQTFVQSEL